MAKTYNPASKVILNHSVIAFSRHLYKFLVEKEENFNLKKINIQTKVQAHV